MLGAPGRAPAQSASILLGVAAAVLLVGTALAQEVPLPPAPPAVGNVALPRDLSPWGMFLNADIVVKVVMVGLLLASVVTWTIWLVKAIELHSAKRRARDAVRILQAAHS